MSVDVTCGYELVHPLVARGVPAFAAIDTKRTAARMCVVERLAREDGASLEALAAFQRDAKRSSLARSPNLARVREVVAAPSSVLLVTEWVDGQPLADLVNAAVATAKPLPLGALLRVIVDVLDGLRPLHELRDGKSGAPTMVHGQVAPRNVILASDGRAVVIHPVRAPAGWRAEAPLAPDVAGYLAPEVLRRETAIDPRADVYGAGVLLWEALAGRRMHPDGLTADAIAARLDAGAVEAPERPGGYPWAKALVDIAAQAAAIDRTKRFESARAMLDAVRKAASWHVVPRSDVATVVTRVAGERIKARQAWFRPATGAAATSSGATKAARAAIDSVEVVELDVQPDTVPAPLPPPVKASVPAAPLRSGPPPLPSLGPPPLPAIASAPHAPGPPPMPARAERPRPPLPPPPEPVEVVASSIGAVASPPVPRKGLAPSRSAMAIGGTVVAAALVTIFVVSHKGPVAAAPVTAQTVERPATPPPPTPSTAPEPSPPAEPTEPAASAAPSATPRAPLPVATTPPAVATPTTSPAPRSSPAVTPTSPPPPRKKKPVTFEPTGI